MFGKKDKNGGRPGNRRGSSKSPSRAPPPARHNGQSETAKPGSSGSTQYQPYRPPAGTSGPITRHSSNSSLNKGITHRSSNSYLNKKVSTESLSRKTPHQQPSTSPAAIPEPLRIKTPPPKNQASAAGIKKPKQYLGDDGRPLPEVRPVTAAKSPTVVTNLSRAESNAASFANNPPPPPSRGLQRTYAQRRPPPPRKSTSTQQAPLKPGEWPEDVRTEFFSNIPSRSPGESTERRKYRNEQDDLRDAAGKGFVNDFLKLGKK